MTIIRLWAILIGAMLLGAPAAAQTFPKFTGLVVDAADVLPPQTEADLTAKLQALQKDTHRQLVVVTVPDLQGYPIDDYGYKLGREWGVGLRDVNNGVILLIAPKEPPGHRGPSIEVGYGLEPVITDALASNIIRHQMMPKLKNGGDIPGAMEAGADAIIQQLRASPDEAKARTDAAIAEFDKSRRRSSSDSSSVGGIPFAIVFWLIVIAFIALSRMRRGKSGRHYRGGIAPVVLWGPGLGGGSGSGWSSSWGSGGGGGGGSSSDNSWGGGGFSGGGGGSFGGGGASGDW
jgi:uncharacterized protein